MSYKSFVIKFLISIGGICVFAIFALWYCSRIGEHNYFTNIVHKQMQTHALYGTLLNQNLFEYKLELIKAKKPEIIALGSSRVLQFREEFFNASFINAGNGMNTLNEGIEFIESTLIFHKPKLIILGLDFWWFNALYPNYTKGEYRSITGKQISSTKFKDILTLICKGNFFKPQYIIDNHFINNPYTKLNSLGLDAIYNSRGFLKDGSYLYGEIFNTKAIKDIHFNDTLKHIKQSSGKFEYAKHIAQERMQSLLKLLDILHKHHIEVVIFFPPIAPTIYKAMQKKTSEYNYIDELFANLTHQKIDFFNYHNPMILKNDDCEFIDGFHGGDVFYARILADMGKKDKRLKTFINTSYLNKVINFHRGKVFFKDSISNYLEQDFLEINCKKS